MGIATYFCEICGREMWTQCTPLPTDDRYCTSCAEACCEIVQDINDIAPDRADGVVIPKSVWDKVLTLFTEGPALCEERTKEEIP